ncbi:nucleotidyltransferase family protein [Thermomicrobium sp. 4228-Ro]|uniref:nucleotidyltransferase family protein n=1 Tax=Thermomicrobium sp. 4228-Ro TaxID=2993937 RepID=UPI0022488B11|nr:nucleotidyltransferase family protein [Thermomicrobium sp. 4228-Ro]MCX2727517.1 nucleotidyltransferase family protein [Thermomicrobium sp. 4228-Ro]
MPRVAGVILAAGLSTRLGRPKQLVELCGKPALQHVIDAVRRTRLSPVILVINPTVAEHLALLDTHGCTTVLNEHPEEGQSSSVRVGLAAVPPECDAAVFILGDQPFIEPATIDGLIELFSTTGALVVRPRYADGPGNPVLISRRLFDELAELVGDTGARPVLARYAEAIVEYDARHRPMPLDLDTPEDIERAQHLCTEGRRER